MSEIHEVLIIGSGPAGYTAALYAGRAGLKPVVLAGHQPGGQLMITTDVENYPGYPDGVMGPAMMDDFRKQAERFGAIVLQQHVNEVDFSDAPYTVKTVSGETHRSRTVIVATGASAKWIGLKAEELLGGRGVSACATCDGFFFRGKNVIVVGGGDTAMEEATYLTRHAEKVYVVHRRDTLRASKIMQERAFKNPKIEFIWNTALSDIKDVEAGKVTGVVLRDVNTGAEREMAIDGVFVAIGHEPNTQVFADWLDRDDLGYIVVHDGTKTKIPGIFACGDATDRIYRQAVTAAGTGCMAAIDAERWLEAQE
ncbi:MAG: thioredoxin-disulfide reductase [Armatimonadetes bacterium]|nr:thioredoxin-disulfide reductase [Armatimonadota bacterium]